MFTSLHKILSKIFIFQKYYTKTSTYKNKNNSRQDQVQRLVHDQKTTHGKTKLKGSHMIKIILLFYSWFITCDDQAMIAFVTANKTYPVWSLLNFKRTKYKNVLFIKIWCIIIDQYSVFKTFT